MQIYGRNVTELRSGKITRFTTATLAVTSEEGKEQKGQDIRSFVGMDMLTL
jgi:hypothetical protein